MADRERAREILGELRALGVRIAVDDFGTGYSSLSYLRELPIDELKLDRSFVQPMAGDPRAAAIVRSTIDLAHALGMTMVAEGVEDEETANQLAGSACDTVQGYYYARPLPAPHLETWLDRWHALVHPRLRRCNWPGPAVTHDAARPPYAPSARRPTRSVARSIALAAASPRTAEARRPLAGPVDHAHRTHKPGHDSSRRPAALGGRAARPAGAVAWCDRACR